MMGLTGWLAWGLCGALVRGSTYLTANESWVVKYQLSPNPNCAQVGPRMLNQTTLEGASAVVQALMKDHLDCVIHFWVDAQSNVSHPGIVVDIYGNRSRAAAVGSETAAKIFGISKTGYWRIAVDRAQFGKEFVIQRFLDRQEATVVTPADIRLWTLPEKANTGTDNVDYRYMPESIRGEFQIAALDYFCPDPQCESKSTKLKFDTMLQEETTFVKAKDAWNASYEVVPLCSLYPTERKACKRLGTMTEVKGCVARMPNCTVEILATLKQARKYHGLIYDSEKSSTPGARIGVDTLRKLLPQLEEKKHWQLIEVGFEGRDGYDLYGSGDCLRGSRLGLGFSYPDAVEKDTTPTNLNPLDFDERWRMDGFHFVEGLIKYESVVAPGLFRSVADGKMSIDTQWDIDFAVQQRSKKSCDWRQTGCTVKLSLPAGKEKSDYLTEKNNWSTSYWVDKGPYCQRGAWPAGCLGAITDGKRLLTCVDELLKAESTTCRFDIRMDLTQQTGFDGMVVGKEGNRAPIIAIGKYSTSSFFRSPLEDYPFIYLRDVRFDVDIKGIGFKENACDAEGSKGRLVSRTFLDAELPTTHNPANFSNDTWHDAPYLSNEAYQQVVAAVDPAADFSLSAQLFPQQGCVARQQGAQLQLAIPVRKNSVEFTDAADTWVVEYDGLQQTRNCSSDPCAWPLARNMEPGDVMTETRFRACARIISDGNPNCQSNMTIWANQDIVYPGLVTQKGSSTGAFALTPGALDRIQRAVERYPMTRITLDFGGGFFNCKLDNNSKVLYFPEYKNATLSLKTGTDAGLHLTDSGMFTAEQAYIGTFLQAGTYVLNPPRPDCQWSATAARIIFEPPISMEVKLAYLFESEIN